MVGSYKLMHKTSPVCEINFNVSGYVEKVGRVYNERLLPLSINKDNPLNIEFTKWMAERTFSPGRTDIMMARSYLATNVFQYAGIVSLFDCYWFLPTKQSISWDEINPYDNWNNKTDPICLLNLKPNYIHRDTDMSSPNLSIPGNENDFWYRGKDAIYYLSDNIEKDMGYYKKSIGNKYIQPREYSIIYNRLFSAKKAETSKDIESFLLSGIYEKYKKDDQDDFKLLVKALEDIGIDKTHAYDFFQNMYDCDERAGIDDRDLSSVRILRDANTLEIIGFSKL